MRRLPPQLRREGKSVLLPGVAEDVMLTVWDHFDSSTRQKFSTSSYLLQRAFRKDKSQPCRFLVELESFLDIVPGSESARYLFHIEKVYVDDGIFENRVLHGVAEFEEWNAWHTSNSLKSVLDFDNAYNFLVSKWRNQMDPEDVMVSDNWGGPVFTLCVSRKYL